MFKREWIVEYQLREGGYTHRTMCDYLKDAEVVYNDVREAGAAKVIIIRRVTQVVDELFNYYPDTGDELYYNGDDDE